MWRLAKIRVSFKEPIKESKQLVYIDESGV
jgi:hypothetical protein